ncbi:MAG: hypothetical protein GXY83_07720 [Rhodopirellula sp.]|nr:hypothetical protein [Rhodopirellula sp.]
MTPWRVETFTLLPIVEPAQTPPDALGPSTAGAASFFDLFERARAVSAPPVLSPMPPVSSSPPVERLPEDKTQSAPDPAWRPNDGEARRRDDEVVRDDASPQSPQDSDQPVADDPSEVRRKSDEPVDASSSESAQVDAEQSRSSAEAAVESPEEKETREDPPGDAAVVGVNQPVVEQIASDGCEPLVDEKAAVDAEGPLPAAAKNGRQEALDAKAPPATDPHSAAPNSEEAAASDNRSTRSPAGSVEKKDGTETTPDSRQSKQDIVADAAASDGESVGRNQGHSEDAAGIASEENNRPARSRDATATRGGRRESAERNAGQADGGPAAPQPADTPQPQPANLNATSPQSLSDAADPLPQTATTADTGKSEPATATTRAAEGVATDRVGGNTTARSSNAAPAHGDAEATQADRVRFVQRVARAFESVGDGGSVRLRLHPPELGSLRVEVTVRNGAMTARLEAETPAAKSLLLENLPMLRERLAEQNVRVERFDVDLADHSGSGAGHSDPGADPHRYHQPYPVPQRGSRIEIPAESAAARLGPIHYTDGGRFDTTI